MVTAKCHNLQLKFALKDTMRRHRGASPGQPRILVRHGSHKSDISLDGRCFSVRHFSRGKGE
jgi:hypothetical protein